AGESGCGKSTLLKIIYGYLRPPLIVKQGSVILPLKDERVSILSLSEEERRRKVWWKVISWIPQNSMNVLNPTMRIKDNFVEIMRAHMNIAKKEAMEMAIDYLHKTGLPKDVINAFPHQLSGGMRQRLVIALALITKPQIILADEPSTALDVVMQRGVLQLLANSQRTLRNTIVMVTHDLAIHAMLCDRVAIMYAGKIVEIATSKELFEDPLHPYTQMLLASLPRLGDKELRQGIRGSPPDLSAPPKGCRFHPRCTYMKEICKSEPPLLVEADKEHFVSCYLYSGV
ncbi:MAG: ABC transporter ATP-binding protein, partial [Candidatus Parvarchaeota archaeon]